MVKQFILNIRLSLRPKYIYIYHVPDEEVRKLKQAANILSNNTFHKRIKSMVYIHTPVR